MNMTRWRKSEDDLRASAGRAASDVEMHKAFLERNGLTQWAFVGPGRDDIGHVLRAGSFPRGYRPIPKGGYPAPPYIDHARFYRGDSPAVLVYHPYFRPEEIRPQVEKWAAENGLTARVFDSGKSWYYPGHTCLVAVTADAFWVAV